MLEAKLAQVITARDAVVDEINALIRSAANTDFNPDAFETDHATIHPGGTIAIAFNDG